MPENIPLFDRRITFGGEEIPAYIASSPHIIRATRKMSITPIPGTSREHIQMEDAWEPYDQPYSLFIGDGSEDSIQEAANAVALKLYKNGWQILEDDYEPDIYRLAYFQGPFDIENRYTRLGRFDINFRCRAERYLKNGNEPVSVNNGDSITNPTTNNSKPLIHITGSGNGTLIIAGQQINIKGLVDYINIDSDTQDAYRLPSENKNSMMVGSFPVLYPGANNISFTDGIATVTITPRFWRL